MKIFRIYEDFKNVSNKEKLMVMLKLMVKEAI